MASRYDNRSRRQHAAANQISTSTRSSEMSSVRREDDRSIDPSFTITKQKQQQQQRDNNDLKSSFIMHPPQTTAALQSVSIEEGDWKGLMTIPRAVSHDQSDDMDSSPRSMNSRSSNESSSSSSSPSVDVTTAPTISILRRSNDDGNEDQHHQWNVSHLTQEEDFSRLLPDGGRYDCVQEEQEQEEGGGGADVNRTAYYSASGEQSLVSPASSLNSNRISLSPSPPPSVQKEEKRLARNHGSNIAQPQGIEPSLSQIEEEENPEEMNNNHGVELKELPSLLPPPPQHHHHHHHHQQKQQHQQSHQEESSSLLSLAEINLMSGSYSLPSTIQPSSTSATSVANDNDSGTVVRNQSIFVSRRGRSSSPPRTTTTSIGKVNQQRPSSSSSSSSSLDIISFLRKSRSVDDDNQGPSASSSTLEQNLVVRPTASSSSTSQISSIQEELSKSTTNNTTSLHPPPPIQFLQQQQGQQEEEQQQQSRSNDFALMWRGKGILDSDSVLNKSSSSSSLINDEDDHDENEAVDKQETEPSASQNTTTCTKKVILEATRTVGDTDNWGLSTQLMAPSATPFSSYPDDNDKLELEEESFQLFELHQLDNNNNLIQNQPSAAASVASAAHDEKTPPRLSDSPLPMTTTPDNSDANLSLGHYLSSCSSDDSPNTASGPGTIMMMGGKESEPEPRCSSEEDRTVLSDIDVSRWTTEGSVTNDVNQYDNRNDKISLMEKERRGDNASVFSHINNGNNNNSISEQQQEDAPRTPQKQDIVLDPKDFNSPSTTARKNSLHISLEESTAYVARIEALEKELAVAKRAIKEQKEFYDDQLNNHHHYTIPLHPHSPFDPHNHQKHSPGTQQRKLLERNQTLLKEVRFADQTCVELSEQNAALQDQLRHRESELEQVRQDIRELKAMVIKDEKLKQADNVADEGLAQKLNQDKLDLEQQLQGANEDKRGLERQLHAAYDKLDLKNKEIRSLQDQHAAELESIVSQKDGILSTIREQMKSVSDVSAQQKHALEMQQRELQDVGLERDQHKHAWEMQQRELQDLALERDQHKHAWEMQQRELADLASERESKHQKLLNLASERDQQQLALQTQEQKLENLVLEREQQQQTMQSLQKKLDQMTSDKDVDKQALEMQQKQFQALALERDEAIREVQMHQQELQAIASEKDSLQSHVQELASIKSKYQASLREKDVFGERLNRMSTAISEANHALLVSQQEHDDTAQKLESSQRDCQRLNLKLREAEHRLQEVSELKDHLAARNNLAQDQADSWKLQVERLQKDLDRALEAEPKESQSDISRAPSGDSQSKVAELAKEPFWQGEAQFATRVEYSLKQMIEATSAAIEKISAHKCSQLVQSSAKEMPTKEPIAGKLSPSLLTHVLSSSNSLNGEILSPQVIQILQLILTFTQQHLDGIDQKVEQVTSQYSARISRQHQLINHIRSSLVFEDDGEEPTTSKHDESSTKEICPDATFAAVTSIPDQKVELMEEARSMDAEEDIEASADPQGAFDSPARETILDLSKIEAVNSPFLSSDITFSMESEAEDRVIDKPKGPQTSNQQQQRRQEESHHQKMALHEPIDLGTKELELLSSLLLALQKDYMQHRTQLRTFVELQQSSLKQITDEASSNGARVSRLVKERNVLLSDLKKSRREVDDCNEKIRICTIDLKAAQRSKERLASENSANMQRIATLQQDLENMEDRLLGNGRERPLSRMSSFQERLEASISATSSSDTACHDHQQLRSELAEANRSRSAFREEISRLQKTLRESEDAHTKLKIEYVSSNEKLAAAAELAEKRTMIEEELRELKENEAQLRAEVSRLVKQVQDVERGALMAENHYSILKEKYQTAQSNLEVAEQEQATLQSKLEESLLQKQRIHDESQKKMTEAEEAHIKLLEDAGEMRKTISCLEEKIRSEEERQSVLSKEAKELQAKFSDSTKELSATKQALLEKTCAFEKAVEELTKLKETASNQENLLKEVSQLKQELHSTQESHNQLKVSYVSCNARLAEAEEKLEHQQALFSEKEDLEVQWNQAEAESAQKQDKLIKQVQQAKELQIEQEAAAAGKLEKIQQELLGKTILLQDRDAEVAKLREAAFEASTLQQNLTEEISQLEQTLRSQEGSYENLKMAFAEGSEKIAAANEELEKNAVEKEHLQLQLKQAEDELILARGELEKARQREEGEAKELEDIQTDLLAKDSALQKAQAEVAKLQMEALMADARREEVTKQVLQLEEELVLKQESQDKELQKHTAERDGLAMQLKYAEEELDKARVSHIEALAAAKEMEQIKAELSDKDEILQNAQARVVQLQNQVSEAESFHQQCNDKIQRLQEELHSTRESHNNLKSNFAECNEKLADAREQIEERDNTLKLLGEVKKSMARELEQAQDETRCTREEMLKKLEATSGELKKAREEQDFLFQEKQSLEQHLQELEEEVTSVKMSYVSSNNKLAEKEGDIEDLTQRLCDSEDAVKHLENEIAKSLEASMETSVQLNSEIAYLKEENSEVSKQLQHALEAKARLEEELLSTRKDFEETMEKLRESRDLKEQLANEVASVNQDIAELQTRLASATEKIEESVQMEEQMQGENTTITKERDGLLEELRGADEEREAMRDAIEATKQKLEEHTADLGRELKKSNTQLLQSLEECQHLRSELRSLHEQKGSYEAEIMKNQQIEEEYEKLKVNFALCNEKLANLLDQCDAAESLTESTENRLLECQNELEALRKEREDLEHQLRDIRQQLVMADQVYSEYKSSQEQWGAEMSQEMQKLRDEKDAVIQTKEAELGGLAMELQGLRKAVATTIALVDDPVVRGVESDHNTPNAREELQHLNVSIPSLCETASAMLDKLKSMNQESHQLNEELGQMRAIERDLRASLQDEKVLCDELATQLSDSRAQVDYSSSKIQRLSNALEEARAAETDERRRLVWSETARHEAKLRYESELGLKVEAGDETEAKLVESESKLMTLSSKFVKAENELASYKERLAEAHQDLKVKEMCLVELESKREHFETKCQKLRVYMRKITDKCEIWESSYAQQSKVLEDLYKKYKLLKDVGQAEQPFQQPRMEEHLGQESQPSNGSPRSVLDIPDDKRLEEHLNQYVEGLHQSISWSS